MTGRACAAWLAVVALVLIGVGLVGNADRQDEDDAQDLYCYNVAHNVWPDYQGTFKNSCPKDLHK